MCQLRQTRESSRDDTIELGVTVVPPIKDGPELLLQYCELGLNGAAMVLNCRAKEIPTVSGARGPKGGCVLLGNAQRPVRGLDEHP